MDHIEGGDVFVHYTVIQGDGYRVLQEDDQVEARIILSAGKLKATEVRRIA